MSPPGDLLGFAPARVDFDIAEQLARLVQTTVNADYRGCPHANDLDAADLPTLQARVEQRSRRSRWAPGPSRPDCPDGRTP